jgi:hemerythrin HHE cation binding domain-containing protein
MSNAVAAPPARPDTREMIVIHNLFRRIFGDLPGLIRGVAVGDAMRAGVLADAFVEVATGLHHHHTNEDEILWPTLLARVEVERSFVLRAEEQHERVHELLERGHVRAASFRTDPSAEKRETFAATVAELDAVLREHMADEERYILPLVEAHMTVAEWDQLGERGRASIPKDRLLIQLGWILDGLDPEQRKEFLASMPVPARLAWRLLGRRKFEKERRRIYGA